MNVSEIFTPPTEHTFVPSAPPNRSTPSNSVTIELPNNKEKSSKNYELQGELVGEVTVAIKKSTPDVRQHEKRDQDITCESSDRQFNGESVMNQVTKTKFNHSSVI